MITTKAYFNQLKTVFGVLSISLVLLLIVSIYFLEPSRFFEIDMSFILANSVLLFVSLLITYLWSNNKIKVAKSKSGLGEKLSIYKTALYLKWGLLLLIAVYSIIGYQLTSDDLFIFVTLFLIMLLVVNRPSVAMVCDNLKLNTEEKVILKDPYSIF